MLLQSCGEAQGHVTMCAHAETPQTRDHKHIKLTKCHGTRKQQRTILSEYFDWFLSAEKAVTLSTARVLKSLGKKLQYNRFIRKGVGLWGRMRVTTFYHTFQHCMLESVLFSGVREDKRTSQL